VAINHLTQQEFQPMARKNSLNHKPFVDVDMSLATSTSAKSDVTPVDQATAFVYWTGTTVDGVMTVQGSNNTVKEFATGAEVWQDLDFGTAIDIDTDTGAHQLHFNALPFKFIRFIYTRTTGTGTINVNIQATSVGA